MTDHPITASELLDEHFELSTEELGRRLRKMYNDAPQWEKVAHVILFGIQYADQIGRRAGKIVAAADIGNGRSYTTEVSKGRQLAQYVAITRSV